MLFFITGPDTYRARQKLNELREKFRREVDPTGLNLETIDGATIDASSLRHRMYSAPLLARRRFIVFENLLTNKKSGVKDALGELLKKTIDDTNVIVLFEAEPPKGKQAILSWLKTHAHYQEFMPLQGRALTSWVESFCGERQRAIDTQASERLLAIFGNDLWRLSSEIKKIDAFLASGKTIDDKTVEALQSEQLPQDIFAFVDAVVRGDLAQSTKRLINHLQEGVSPQQLIALLEKQFRVLLILSEASSRRSAPTIEGVHPYIVTKLRPLARKYDYDRLKKIYADLAEIDVALKTTNTDPAAVFVSYFVGLAES